MKCWAFSNWKGNTMSVFAIADPHLSLGTDKPMDIFKGWADYIQRLEKNWRGVVSDKDTVVLPGDISWGMDLKGALPDFQFLNGLPGKKIILKGNHDYWWTTRRKMESFFAQNGLHTLSVVHNDAVAADGIAVCGTRGWFFDAEDDQDKKVLLREAGRLRASLEVAKCTGLEPVVFLHYPPVYEDKVCEEIYRVLTDFAVRRCFYGHIHGFAVQKSFNGERDGIKFRLVSCDYTGFCPVLVEKSV